MEYEDKVEATEPTSISRRKMLKRIGAGAAIAWSAPILSGITTPAFGQTRSPETHPECAGATCVTFTPCSSSNTDCVCASTDQGGFCHPGSTPCAGLADCPNGTSAECPPGEVCAVDTCCGRPVCLPIALTDQCPPGGAATGTRTSTGPGTVGG